MFFQCSSQTILTEGQVDHHKKTSKCQKLYQRKGPCKEGTRESKKKKVNPCTSITKISRWPTTIPLNWWESNLTRSFIRTRISPILATYKIYKLCSSNRASWNAHSVHRTKIVIFFITGATGPTTSYDPKPSAPWALDVLHVLTPLNTDL